MAWNLQPVVIQAIYQTCVTIQMDQEKDKKVTYKIGFTLQSILIQWNYENRRSISYMCVQELSDEKEEE